MAMPSVFTELSQRQKGPLEAPDGGIRRIFGARKRQT